MIKISALTPGINAPASRFRVRQYIPLLNKVGIYVKEFPAKIDDSTKLPWIFGRVKQRYIFPISVSWVGVKAISRINDIIHGNHYDAVWLSRLISSSVFMEQLIRRPLIYDVDDAIWINNERKIIKIAQNASLIFAGNSFIVNWLEKFNHNIFLIPTAVDTERFTPIPNRNEETFNIVWTGTSQTNHYLISIEKALACFLKKHIDSGLYIISDIQPKFSSIPKEKITFFKWNPEIEFSILQRANVGIMPLYDTEWEKGKCGLKMLQYMSVELPVVVSPVGMNVEVMKQGNFGFTANKTDDWVDALDVLYKDRNLCTQLGVNGRSIVTGFYSSKIVSQKIAGIIKSHI